MWDVDDRSFWPENFSGTARIFSLPNLVMFPHVMQALRVFEPQHVEIVEDTMADWETLGTDGTHSYG